MGAKIVFTTIGVLVSLMIGSWVLWHLMGLISVLGYALGCMAILAVALYVGYLFMRGTPVQMTPSKRKKDYKLFEAKGTPVYVFRDEPQIADLALISDEMHLTKLELQGDVFQVENESKVIVLDDSRKEAVKVKLSGKKKKEEQVVWVARGSLVSEDRRT